MGNTLAFLRGMWVGVTVSALLAGFFGVPRAEKRGYERAKRDAASAIKSGSNHATEPGFE